MVRPLVSLASGLALVAAPFASAEVFRCVDENGALRFVDRPEACEGAEPYELEDRTSSAREGESGSLRAPVPASPAPLARDLDALLLSAQQAGPGWGIVKEAASDIGDDPDFVSWGVREKLARHYTRNLRGLTQVCSIEIWLFSSVYNARVAAENISYPEWLIDRQDEMLLMIHGSSRAIADLPRRGVFPDCMQLGEMQRRRLAEAVAVGR